MESRVRSVERGAKSPLGIGCALHLGMKAKKLEDLLVYQKALEGVGEVSALVKRPEFGSDLDLRDQLSESSSRIPGHIAEGYGQLTDRHFAHYLGIARGSAKETCAHLATALVKNHITLEQKIKVSGLYDDLASMLTAFIRHLRGSDYKDRW